jgi:indole-3-glycerol phosphate synthase/phosphoribosylanthranilate isomerase
MTNTNSRTLRAEHKNNADINVKSVDGNVLAAILNKKYDYLKKLEEIYPLAKISKDLPLSDRSFYEALTRENSIHNRKTKFILECKKASPSKGLIRDDFNVEEIAKTYNHFADCISVLTDKDFFQGDYEYINVVKNNTDNNIPVLCKDFIYTDYQVYLARYFNADAILLMLSVLTDEAYIRLLTLAHSLNMGVLTESSTKEEVERALKLNAKVIGINNRNLRELTVDLNNVRKLSELIPEDKTIISESGIYTHDQVLELKQYANGFLVGSSLTSEENIELACKKLIYGENKICGITRFEDVESSLNNGFIYNGFIFFEKSKRYITFKQAKEIVDECQKRDYQQNFVGVFVDHDISTIIKYINDLKLHAVQLHGNESLEYVSSLRHQLNQNNSLKDTLIFKAIPFEETFPDKVIEKYLTVADRIILDSKTNDQFGGTGKTFNWRHINKHHAKIIIAGGLTPDNVSQARDLGLTIGVDLNSGLEDSPGIKNKEKIKEAKDKLTSF